MGCSICIDNFLDDSPDNRPACLPCGHVFHVHCAKRWLDECANRPAERRGCPMCKHAASAADLVVLWPSDLDDLDRLLAQRNDPESRWTAELQGVDMEPDEATELLDNLIDFDQAIQAYVMAVLGVRVVATRKAGQRAKKLINSTAIDSEVKEDLATAMDSLQQVLESLQRQRDKFDQRYASLKRQQYRFNEERQRQRERDQQLKRLEAALDQRDKTIDARAEEVLKTKTEVFAEKAELERQQREVEAAKQVARQEVAESNAAATRARIEASQTVAAMQLELNRAKREADDRVAEAESRQRDAEAERDATRAKSNLLADQMRELQRLNREVKAAKADEKTRRQKERADSAKELADLKKRLARAEEKLAAVASASASASASTSTLASAPASSPFRPGSMAASRSSVSAVSPSPSRAKTTEQARYASAMDSENHQGDRSFPSFGSIGRRKRSDSLASTSTDVDESQSTSYDQSQTLSLVVEPPAGLGRAAKRSGRASMGYMDEADQHSAFAGDSDGSDDFPMPGLPASRFRRTHSGVGALGSPTKRSPVKVPPVKARSSSDAFDDDVMMPGLGRSNVGKARGEKTIGDGGLKLSAATLNRSYGVVVGPKHKNKGGW